MQRHRQGRRDKISVISGISVSPQRQHLGLYYLLFFDNIGQEEVCRFLRELLCHLRGHGGSPRQAHKAFDPPRRPTSSDWPWMEREPDDPANNSVIDGDFARVPFLHDAGELGLYSVARLKNNLPELLAAAQKRFCRQTPSICLDSEAAAGRVPPLDKFVVSGVKWVHWEGPKGLPFKRWILGV